VAFSAAQETRLQGSRWIFNKGDVGQARSAEPGPQLKSFLERFPILFVGRVFNGDGVITFADFTAFFFFALALLWNIYKSGRGSWVGDKFRNVILQQTTWMSATTPISLVLGVEVTGY
jgi:hypothetical protein